MAQVEGHEKGLFHVGEKARPAHAEFGVRVQLRPLARLEMHQRLGAATGALTCRCRPIDLRLDRCSCVRMTAVFLSLPLKEHGRTSLS